MKKIYIKPTQRIHNVRIRTYMQTVSPTTIYERETTSDAQLTKEHDLWGNEW